MARRSYSKRGKIKDKDRKKSGSYSWRKVLVVVGREIKRTGLIQKLLYLLGAHGKGMKDTGKEDKLSRLPLLHLHFKQKPLQMTGCQRKRNTEELRRNGWRLCAKRTGQQDMVFMG